MFKRRNPIAKDLLLCGQFKARVVSDKKKYNRKKEKDNAKKKKDET